MEATYNISTFIKGKKANHNQPLIYIRITVNGERAEISVKRNIDREGWDATANKVKGNKEDAREINSLIDTLILKLNSIYNKLVANNEIISAQRIKDIFLGKDVKKKTLLEAFQDHNEMVRTRIGIDFSKSTYTRYKTTCDHICEFLKHKYNITDMYLQQIQYSFITDLEHF